MINIVSVIVGFGLWALLQVVLGPLAQIPVQVVIAAAISVLLIILWLLGFHSSHWKSMELQGLREYGLICLAALLWFPLVFYPLHYITQGYLSRFGNVLAMWAFQAPVNLLGLWLASRALRPAQQGNATSERF